MLEKVTAIINIFDPLNLLPYFPPDEYELEIEAILNYLSAHSDIDAQALGKEIFRIFYDSLGDAFNKTLNDCTLVAENILN